MTFVPVVVSAAGHREGMDITHADRIVVGVDGSASSVDALRYAGRISTALHTPLHVVITWTAPPIDPYLAIEWSPEDDARGVLDAVIDDAFDREPPPDLTRAALLGGAARTLIELSDAAAMLVLGSRGHGGFVGLLLGSVSAACAEHAHCPVLIVHTRESLEPHEERPD